jgi:hypothetical protein
VTSTGPPGRDEAPTSALDGALSVGDAGLEPTTSTV